MQPASHLLRDHALRIWHAGVDAVRPARRLPAWVRAGVTSLQFGELEVPRATLGRIVVVGAGKASGAMAAALEQALGPDVCQAHQVSGWVNVPADCIRALCHIHLHAARPAGVNEPTAAGVEGSEQILRRVAELGPNDLVIALLSGGGSALLPAPIPEIGLEDKLAITRALSAGGANIEELNTVRKHLSRIKGGGLARACRAGRLIALVISDVAGDRLDVIASGPAVADRTTPADALDVVERYALAGVEIPPAVERYLRAAARKGGAISGQASAETALDQGAPCEVTHLVIANNATAVEAAGFEAERLGYVHAMVSHRMLEGQAEEVGRHLAEMALHMREHPGPECLISGGEPVVCLVEPARRGRGGRNQQLVLAAVDSLWEDGARGLTLVSGGTDGEDGPTDAAGAWLDEGLLAAARAARLDPRDYLARNDAYHFFQPLEGLIRTGPTETNVCDLRVVLVRRPL